MADDTWKETLTEWYDWAAESYFGKCPKEIIRETQTDIRTAIRQLDRQTSRAKLEEAKLLNDVRAASKLARSDKDLYPVTKMVARARRGIARSERLKFDLVGMSQDMLETSVQSDMTDIMFRVTNALGQVHAMTGGANAMTLTVNRYERQKETLETMREKIEEMNADAGEDADARDTLSQLKDELALSLAYEMPRASRGQPLPERVSAASDLPSGLEDEVQTRFDSLKRKP